MKQTRISEFTEEESSLSEDTTSSEDREFVSKINMRISHTEFKDLRTNTNTFKNAFSSLLVKQKYVTGLYMRMSREEFDRQTNTLYKCCLKIIRDRHELHKRRVMGLTVLNDIILRGDPVYMTMDHVIHLTWSIMSCLHHFQLRVRSGTRGLVSYTRKRTVARCITSYTRLIKIFPPKMHRVVLNSILTFYQEGKLWLIEFACRDLIVELLHIYRNAGEAISDILDTIERVAKKKAIVAKYLVQVLYQTLSKVKWHRVSGRLLVRFVSLLERSIMKNDRDIVNYEPLRNGIQLCVRNAIDNMKNESLMLTARIILTKLNTDYTSGSPSEIVTCLANLAAYATSKYKITTFYKEFPTEFLQQIFTFIDNDTHTYVLGLRIWRNILDRNRNATSFMTPRIFYRTGMYKIKIKKCRPTDILYMKSYVHKTYPATIRGFMMAKSKNDLELVYQAIAVTLVEVPCGYTAATYVAILMTVQKYALLLPEQDILKSHYVHAIILSLMTLICYIHKADALYDYVYDVMYRRSRLAPHLNPPLKTSYAYAQNYVLWNKPNFFFEEWETRYGLWQCFRKTRREKFLKS